MSDKRTKYTWIGGHKILELGILCLVGFCLPAQGPGQKKGEGKTATAPEKDSVGKTGKTGQKEEPKQKRKS